MGKLIITVVVLLGLFATLLFGGADESPHAWALLGATLGYVFANGKQLVSPFAPSPMMVPKPAAAAKLLAQQVADYEAVHDAEDEA